MAKKANILQSETILPFLFFPDGKINVALE